ncbi:hypothetical protein, unknown function [Leishmania tarentolae]|uniref:Uncharacterized protein n=1 Tax=Leishmania tarentolae TaxID=5689 RepID=A0A640KFC7_LEITA|nr:hypothetical protein, unknown function [Leishmania tarentolae]
MCFRMPHSHFLTTSATSNCRLRTASPPPLLHFLMRTLACLHKMDMRQRVDTQDSGGGGVFDTHEKLRQANSEKLQNLLNRTAHRTTAARDGEAQRVKKSASLTGDYLDFQNDEFTDKWINVGMGLMVAVALFLFYVLWFTDWVR